MKNGDVIAKIQRGKVTGGMVTTSLSAAPRTLQT